MKKKILLLFVISFTTIFFIQCNNSEEQQNSIDKRLIGQQPDGSILVPSNQVLRPEGFQIYFPGRPVDLATSNDGKWLAVFLRTENIFLLVKHVTA